MSIKVKQALVRCFEKIEDDTFDEDTIRTLLIVSREYLKYEGLIKELAHFIAHPIRNRGMFHKKLNSRYAKFKLAEEQMEKMDFAEIEKDIKTEEEFCDFMTGGVSVEKVESKLFEILYIDGLEDLPESHLIKYTRFSKKEVRKLFSEYYIKKDGYYYLTTNKTERMISLIRNLPESQKKPELNKLMQAESLVTKIKSQIDSIQRVVRGAICYNSVFETKTLHREIESAISHVIKQFNIDQRFIYSTKERLNDILLCIMTLLHDSKFVFYDKTEARAYLCYYRQREFKEGVESNTPDIFYNSGVIALYISYKRKDKTTNIPLFVSDLPIKRYLDIDTFNSKGIDFYNGEIDWISANRKENKLQLVETSE